MALKIWTFLLVMSLPAAEHGRGFVSLATVLSTIDYHRIQQKLLHTDGKTILLTIPPPPPPPSQRSDSHRVDKRAAPKITNKKHYATMMAASSSGVPSVDGRCMARVQSALGDMMSATSVKNGNRRHTGVPQSSSSGFMDLSGYALHQRLRTAPGAEMYVTGMRAKVVSPQRDAAESSSAAVGVDDDAAIAGDHRSWALVDGCQYDPLGNTLEARMRFGRILMVSGSVRLLYGGGSKSSVETGCDMTLRLRPRAGLGFTAVPLTVPEKLPPNRLTATPTMTIRTTATFIDPEPAADDPMATYVSVHSYNCVGGAAAFPGNREQQQPAASSDRFEQILSAEDGSDESTAGGNADFDVNVNWDDESVEFGDGRTGGRRPTPQSSSKTITAKPAVDAVPAVNTYVPAGFVGPTVTTTGPEPRLRKIQYLGKPLQHPILTVINGHHHHSHHQAQDQLLMEMEEVFVRGVRSLLAKHMERALQPVLKDSLMANMGYTVSYG